MEREKIKTTPERLNEAMAILNLKQVDILGKAQYFCEKYNIKLTKSDLSQYVSGKVTSPTQDKLFVLANALNVSEAWLMGFDVPMERKTDTPAPAPADFSSAQNEEQQLIELYRQLNPEGQEKVTDYADDLVNSGKYKKSADTVGNIA